MSTQQDINAIRAQRPANTHDPLALMANPQTPFHPDQSSHITYNIHNPTTTLSETFIQLEVVYFDYMPQPMKNPKDISDPTTVFDMALELMFKALQLNNITTTNNKQQTKKFIKPLLQSDCSIGVDQPRSNSTIVRIKSLLEVTAAKLVMLAQKLLLLVLKVNVAGIKVTTAERIKIAQRKDCLYPLKWDQQVVSKLVALRNFAKKTWIKTQYIWWLHQKCLCSNQNGNAPPITKVVEGVETTIAP
ncbi:hypothetical protein Tco_0580134, partial [Tanacetum coccineum]